ncbi:hypothetical protein DXT99_08425 [Pontibacter diazotrophicus]|uniref:Uncharacterized protein n=1 Tax=Pontibacter diazotrophicus TaxID=1400979 RepID=A0A3D8LDM7_9BACT|nr:hypothetical protein [Pontibacter diazotrophicus]RDV15508.1 hypothetical protein DXT99_08425 [Pontibacter diazotrophicus]
MDKKTLYFWLLFVASIIISGVIISIFVKAMKVVLMVILALALAPVIFFILKRLLIPGDKDKTDKLKKRD